MDNHLILDRRHFRIQQEVPFKSSKRKSDTITLGTQLMKLLFGDGIMDIEGFTFEGVEKTGRQLHQLYNDTFISLIEGAKQQLFSELGLDEQGNIVDAKRTAEKLQTLLKDEAEKRGYPLQDIEALNLHEVTDSTGKVLTYDFAMPLWASTNSNRYESMLNAIVTNRLIRMKFPGNSYVIGSEEGFRTATRKKVSAASKMSTKEIINELFSKQERGQIGLAGEDIDTISDIRKNETPELRKKLEEIHISLVGGYQEDVFDEGLTEEEARQARLERKGIREEGEPGSELASKMIYTDAWNGKELQATYTKDGKLIKAQVFAASKFRDNDGNLINLLSLNEDGKTYKYVNQDAATGRFSLKPDMFDKELLSLMSFRIPSSGLQSGSVIEIAGFLPHQSADLMIVPKNFTKQKGSDFDIDKENAYQLFHRMNKDGKFEVLAEKHRDIMLAEADRLMKDKKINDLRKAVREAESQDKRYFAMKELRDAIAQDKFFESVFQSVGIPTFDEQDLEDAPFLKKMNAKINEMLGKNTIIKIKQAVYSHASDEVQKKIAKVLSTDFAEGEADFIDRLKSKSGVDNNWTALSDEYQKQKMMSGASGKTGTGAYSLDVVTHSLVQQLRAQGKPITLEENIYDDEGNIVGTQTKIWSFGNVTTTGVLGGDMTLGPNKTVGDRSIVDLLVERQNINLDNEKLQIIGRVGIDEMTMDVDKIFNLLGVDKGSDGHSIAMLFLSQPIIRDYVLYMKNANSNMSHEFSATKEEDIRKMLIDKYGGEEETASDGIKGDYWSIASGLMTNDAFIRNIEGTISNQLQRAVLRRFIEMKEYGESLRNVQTAINTDSKGLGKSTFDVIERKNTLNRLGNNGKINGASSLIGDYKPITDEMSDDERIDLIKQGYVDIGNFLVKPTTLSGAFSIQGVMTAYKLWSRYMPYDSEVLNSAFDELLPLIGNGALMNESKNVELKQEIFKHMKKYFAANRLGGIMGNTDDANTERKRLYIDYDGQIELIEDPNAVVTLQNEVIKEQEVERVTVTVLSNGKPVGKFSTIPSNLAKLNKVDIGTAQIHKEGDKWVLYHKGIVEGTANTSLGTYIKRLKAMNHPAVNEFIKTNMLFNRIEVVTNKNGQPTLIKYNNAAGEEFDENYLYEALSTLFQHADVELPEIDNKKYTLGTLAQDMIAYTMLGNSTQEAIQFSKYIPVGYFSAVGYAQRMRNITNDLRNNNTTLLGASTNWKTDAPKEETDWQSGLMDDDGLEHYLSEFAIQFIQHNPERLKAGGKLKKKDLKKKVILTPGVLGNSYENLKSFIPRGPERPPFFSMYDSTIPKGDKKFKLYWYDGEKYIQIPVLGVFGMDEYQPSYGNNEFSIGKSLVNGRVPLMPRIQKSVPNSKTTTTSDKDSFEVNSGNITTVLENIGKGNSNMAMLARALAPFAPADYTIEWADKTPEGEEGFAGIHNAVTKKIYINPIVTERGNDYTASIILHEIVHALTVTQIDKFTTTYTGGELQANNGAPTAVVELVRLYNDVKSKENDAELQELMSRLKAAGGGMALNKREYNLYGLTDIYEFMALALTEPKFQEYLASKEFKQSGKTLLEKFQEIVANLLKSIGVAFESDTAAAQAIANTFQFIEEVNPTSTSEKSDTAYNDTRTFGDSNEDSDGMDSGDEFGRSTGPPLGRRAPLNSPSTKFPNKKLVIRTEKCN